MIAAILTHGGAGNDGSVRDGCEAACRAGLTTSSALDAAIAAVLVLEDDPRMNAGTGAVLRLDGKAQMDASVMTLHRFGAVAVVEDVKNPVLLARAVHDSPHMMLAGAGAGELADRLGLARASPVTERQRARHAARMAHLDDEPSFRRLYTGVDEKFWRIAVAAGEASDTVGAVVRASDGTFAAASSTGGIWCAVRGRVGDTPIPGAGVYVGEAGAVAATGTGEFIWREMLA
ncbi:MAG TPA: isoaspartyl peptidase/L-asparaginase, partial [Myxococcota bacterium]